MTAHIENTLEFSLCADDETPIFVRDWPLPETGNKERTSTVEGVVIMHGLGEHCGRYAHVARFFNALGYIVRTYDHRGHGQSGGSRGDVPDDTAMVRDAALVINDFRRQLDAPPIVLGHSMGGLFAARFATESVAPIKALILSSPALAIYMSALQHRFLSIAKAIFPGLGIPNGLKTHFLSHDAEVVYAYKNDRLVHGKISARLLTSMLNTMDFSLQHASGLQVPVLVLVALDDHLVDPKGSQQFAHACLPDKVTTHLYPGFYHELFNELDATRVFDDIRTWLEVQHLSPH
ncbi:alpha/beta hydrolase [Undibacterium sp. MH2W]|uniref:alpha/beta hydrolase n=1 Tax=Undibacterium sp. MH2W TaxID=3413044 RepID=UPI003BEFFF2E